MYIRGPILLLLCFFFFLLDATSCTSLQYNLISNQTPHCPVFSSTIPAPTPTKPPSPSLVIVPGPLVPSLVSSLLYPAHCPLAPAHPCLPI
jgi:hypothetical protein